jgi:hypothetical protein
MAFKSLVHLSPHTPANITIERNIELSRSELLATYVCADTCVVIVTT